MYSSFRPRQDDTGFSEPLALLHPYCTLITTSIIMGVDIKLEYGNDKASGTQNLRIQKLSKSFSVLWRE